LDTKVPEINMQVFAKNAGTNMSFSPGSIVFKEGDAGNCVYVVQSGVIEILTHDKVVDVCGPNDAIGFMSVIDGGPLTATARVREAAELSIIDERKFRFMIDEVPNFAYYIMKAMAHRIRGMRETI
jgi:CRP/FNR family transcriptional regulator, cyclic AMP receptor protein